MDAMDEANAREQRAMRIRNENQVKAMRQELRDRFAIAALQGIVSNETMLACHNTGAFADFRATLAKTAYEIADEMLKARDA